jgi:hypothetical protein
MAILAPTTEILELERFAELHFRHPSGGFGHKKSPKADVARFQATPLAAPLLAATPKASAKAAVEAFRLILAYTIPGKSTAGTTDLALALMSLLSADAALVDEVYFQLLKQTNANVDAGALQFTWQLFLLVCGLFPPSQPHHMWVKAQFYRNASVTAPRLARTIQLASFRFGSRVAIGKPERGITVAMLDAILADIEAETRCFKVSVYEQMWHQERSRPEFGVPFVVVRMANLLVEKGAEKREGIFRLPGNMARVAQLAEALNRGDDQLQDTVLDDLASLFKSWFGGLPIQLVPTEEVPSLLRVAAVDKDYVGFLRTLPPLHRNVITYLIGFLKQMSLAAAVTKMTAKNLAICFSPNIVSSEGVATADVGRHTDASTEFLVSLIEKLDASAIYPTGIAQVGT